MTFGAHAPVTGERCVAGVFWVIREYGDLYVGSKALDT
jgi:hypothetical protein